MRSLSRLVSCLIFIPIFILSACGQTPKIRNQEAAGSVTSKPGNPYYSNTDTTKLVLSDDEWKKVLTPEVYEVSRHAETERPFTGKYWNTDTKGTYYCTACGNLLFRSDAKFSSSCGWPSFFEQLNTSSVVYKTDNTLGIERIEALCGRCEGHLGHLFEDGPPPRGKRYCMNSIALDFIPDSK